MARQVRLQGVVNFRDVGLSVNYDSNLLPGRLFRCTSLDKATKSDRHCLQHELGISTLIDLNGPSTDYILVDATDSLYRERFLNKINSYHVLDLHVHEISLLSPAFRESQWKKVPWQDKAYDYSLNLHNASILILDSKAFGYALLSNGAAAQNTVVRATERDRKKSETVKQFLKFSRPQVKAIFEALASEDACPVLIYGLNTTSLVICLILMLLDVPAAAIAHDHSLSKEHADAMLEEINAKRRANGVEEQKTLDFPEDYVEEIVEVVEREYRGIEVYLASIELTDEQLQRVKRNMRGTRGAGEKLVDLDF